MAHAARRGETYRLRWDIAAQTNSFTATQLQPFRAPLLQGGEIDVSATVDKPLVLTFWASWCDPCVQEAPHLVRLAERYGHKLRVISVSIDEADAHDALRAVVERIGITYPVALDAGGAAILPKYAQGIGIPLTFVIDASGAIRYTHHNYRAGDEAVLVREVEEVLRGAPVSRSAN